MSESDIGERVSVRLAKALDMLRGAYDLAARVRGRLVPWTKEQLTTMRQAEQVVEALLVSYRTLEDQP